MHTNQPWVALGEMVDRKDGIAGSIRSGSYRAVVNNTDVELFEGHGRFVGADLLEIDGTTIEADRVFLNTGTRDALPPIDGLDRVGFLTSCTILELRELPGDLIVVGGGFIGCEFAQMFARFGSKVTVVQRADQLQPGGARPSRWASAAASPRLDTSSLARMLETCTLAVVSAM